MKASAMGMSSSPFAPRTTSTAASPPCALAATPIVIRSAQAAAVVAISPRPPCRARCPAGGRRPPARCAARRRCGPGGRSRARGPGGRPRGRDAPLRPPSTPRRAPGRGRPPAPAPAPPAAPSPSVLLRGPRRLVLLLEQAAHGVAGLRALADPVPRPLGVDLDHRGVLARLVMTQDLHEAPVTPIARVRHHHAVVRLPRGPGPSQPDGKHLPLSPFSLTRRLCRPLTLPLPTSAAAACGPPAS